MTEPVIQHHPTCNAHYPEKPRGEAPQATADVDGGDGRIMRVCGDCGAFAFIPSSTLEIWVDDSKPAPEGCAVARTFDDALALMRRYEYSKLYLDHDLGEDAPNRTGYDLLLILQAERRCPAQVVCISWNPVGRKRIDAALASVSDESKVKE
jgi:hypothetical protein